MFKYDGQFYILCNNDNSLRNWPSRQKAADFFEKGYNNRHISGYEGSMSSCYHYLFFTPKVLTIESTTCLVNKAIILPAQIYECSTIAGSLKGMECKGPDAQKLYDSAHEIRLIREPTFIERIRDLIKI